LTPVPVLARAEIDVSRLAEDATYYRRPTSLSICGHLADLMDRQRHLIYPRTTISFAIGWARPTMPGRRRPITGMTALTHRCLIQWADGGEQQYGDVSRGDLHRSADRKAEVMVRAPLIDSNFGKSVGILIPERRADRLIAKGRCPLQQTTRGS
jgi:hypothetical protein